MSKIRIFGCVVAAAMLFAFPMVASASLSDPSLFLVVDHSGDAALVIPSEAPFVALAVASDQLIDPTSTSEPAMCPKLSPVGGLVPLQQMASSFTECPSVHRSLVPI